MKWKISSLDVVAKYRRFAFDGVFDTIKQINNAGKDSTVHVWVENSMTTFFWLDNFERNFQ